MPVEVGISNDDFAEIRSGIEEGTTVFYTEKEEDNFYMMMGGPGMGHGPRMRGGEEPIPVPPPMPPKETE